MHLQLSYSERFRILKICVFFNLVKCDTNERLLIKLAQLLGGLLFSPSAAQEVRWGSEPIPLLLAQEWRIFEVFLRVLSFALLDHILHTSQFSSIFLFQVEFRKSLRLLANRGHLAYRACIVK